MKRPKISKAGLGDALAIVVGAVVAKVATDKLPIANVMLKNAIPVAIGLVLSTGKNKMAKNAGFGMIAAGGANLAGSLLNKAGVAGYMFPGGELVNGFRAETPASGGPM